ncbi:MAG TPA: carbohydrate kinase family protein [Bacteroidales bacterium]|nr:carbohydrate kinase family protein [Bacteroidales bacterium]
MSEKKHDVLVVGELNIDLILNKIDKFPDIGKEVIAREIKQTLGSSSAIFANNLSVLEAKVSFLGKVGNDSYADQINTSLKSSGVDLTYLLKSQTHLTGITVAFNFGNDRAMVTYPGAMNDLTIEDITDEALQSASHLHVSSVFLQESLKPGLTELFQRARKLNLTTSLDTQWDPSEKWDLNLKSLLPWVDIFMPNEIEITRLTKTSTVEDALKKISADCRIVVVKRGVKGALLYDNGRIIEQQAYLNEHVIDAIGAGDSFNAGFISKFIKRKSLEECLDFGALTGAVNTTAAGGTGAFKSFEAVKKCIKENFNKNIS